MDLADLEDLEDVGEAKADLEELLLQLTPTKDSVNSLRPISSGSGLRTRPVLI